MNSRFAVAVHILTLLAESGGAPATSEEIAGSVNTNASLIRRLLGTLARANLTRSQLGSGGGALLARPARSITLGDVYRAVHERNLFAMHRERPNPRCRVGRNIQVTLDKRLGAAIRALEQELNRVTIAELMADIRHRERATLAVK